PDFTEDNTLYSRMGELLLKWRNWCLNRGLLTYGIIYELYWRYLLLAPQYQKHLRQRHQIILADDTDDYPAIAKDLFELLLDKGVRGVFTYNPDSQVRLGVNADPGYLKQIAKRCRIIDITGENFSSSESKIASQSYYSKNDYIDLAVELVSENTYGISLPDTIQSIQTISRAELLRTTAQSIIEAIKSEGIKAEEIAIIAPGLDEIGRYTLIEILSAQGIAVTPVNEQRPLISSPTVRALLTLMALVYPGIGKLVDRDSIAEMLTILSQTYVEGKLIPQIDPVRAGLLADYCYHVDPEFPDLLPIESFPRWDRLGNQGATAYQKIIDWVTQTKEQQLKQCYVTPAIFLSKAIAFFLGKSEKMTYPHHTLSALRELIETAQHYWEVDRRLRQVQPSLQTQAVTVANFITLLRRGTITANPRRNNQFTPSESAVSLATIFQYRSLRTAHRRQYWLDAGSPLWEQGGAATLFGAPLFLQSWSGYGWMPEDQYNLDRERLQRIVRDLLGRVSEKVILCHSDLGVNGTEQMGALFPLVQASRQIEN
ncbi:recombinase family protein, partial [Hyella patelloides]